MTLPSVEGALVMYAVDVLIIWIATRFLASQENKPSVGRCFGAAFLMTVLGNLCYRFLHPAIGNWDLLARLAVFVFVPMAVLRLAWWRASLVALLFYAGIWTQYLFLFGPPTMS